MKRLLSAALLALTSLAFGATTTPVSLINPAGSTAGQAIISSGPSSAPAWGAVPLTGISGTLAIANGGTGATSASAARTSLGAASTGGNTFTGLQTLAYTSPTLDLNDTSGSGGQTIHFANNGTFIWRFISGSVAGNALSIGRYVSGTLTDTPFSISNSTGVVTYSAIPVQPTPSTADNSTNSATTAYVKAQFAGAANNAAFGTLNASGNDALVYSNTSGQSIPNNTATTITGFTKVVDRVNANFNAATGTFTAPATGYYQVSGAFTFSTATGVSPSIYSIGVVANGVTVAQGRVDQGTTASVAVQVAIPLTVVSLTAGQTIIVQATQNTGSARTLSTAAAINFVSINRLP